MLLSGLSVSDVDAGAGAIKVTLSVTGGTVTAANAGGVSVAGSGTSSVELTGTLADINAYLAAAVSQPSFVPAANANGSVTLTMTTTDNGNSGSGGAQVDTDASTINITAVNDAPAGTDTSKTIAEDGNYVFGTADFGFADSIDGDGFAALRSPRYRPTGRFSCRGSRSPPASSFPLSISPLAI